MALHRVSTTKGSANGARRFPRAEVKAAAKKIRRAEDKKAIR